MFFQVQKSFRVKRIQLLRQNPQSSWSVNPTPQTRILSNKQLQVNSAGYFNPA